MVYFNKKLLRRLVFVPSGLICLFFHNGKADFGGVTTDQELVTKPDRGVVTDFGYPPKNGTTHPFQRDTVATVNNMIF